MVYKARPCAKLAGMIDIYLVPINYVSGSHQSCRILHEKITFSTCGQRRWCIHTMTCAIMVSVENYELSSLGPLVLSTVVLRSTGEHVYKRM